MERVVFCYICNYNCNKRYKKQDVVRISAEIKRREIANSNPLICDIPANDQAAAEMFLRHFYDGSTGSS